MRDIPAGLIASLLAAVLWALAAVSTSCASTERGVASAFSEQEPDAVDQGWIEPSSRRILQVFNVVFTLMLLLLTGTSLYFRRKLKEKVLGFQETQRQLEEQNDKLRLVTENATEGIWDFNVESESGTLSRQWHTLLGYDEVEEDISLSEWMKFVHPDDLTATHTAFSDFVEAGGHGQYESEFRVRQADGTWRWILSRGRAVSRDDRGRPLRVIGLFMDIQKAKEIQRRIEQSEENFRRLFECAPIPMASLSEDGTVVEVNDRMTAVLGYSAADIESIEHWWQMACPDPSYRKDVTAAWQSAVDRAMERGTSVAPLECRVTCKDGTERITIVEATIIDRRFLVSFYDLTDHRRAEEEREKLREQLLQAQKLEAVGVLAGGVAHDFNNMIGAIMGYSELILGELETGNPHRRYQECILDAAHRSANLTRQLLAFARKQTVAPVLLDLNQAVESMLKLLHRLIGENIDLVWRPGKGVCRVKIDPSQLDQILANLCVNARDAIDDVGTITIETDRVTFDQAYCDTHLDFRPGEYVLLAVSDNGVGMDEKTITHIFQPFFTTKKLGHGTGMGLATVYGIAKQNDGFVNVYSEPEQGTTFKIYLPSQVEKAAERREIADEGVPLGKGETILLVEDEITLLEMTQAMLEKLGYRVFAAKTPAEAIRTAGEHDGEIHLLITDVIMPEMNGRELADALQRIRPDIEKLFTSGYTAGIIASKGILDEGVNFIQKPFSEKELAAKVRLILD